MNHLSVKELQQRLQKGEDWLLLDVREQQEWEICNLSHQGNAVLVPLNEIPGRDAEVPKDKPVAVYCHHGIRSQHAIMYLQQLGYENLFNLTGGIHAWAEEVEPQMDRY